MINNICIIVCFYNTNPKYLEECFLSIDRAIWYFNRHKKTNIPVEVHVMDDGSDDIYTLKTFENILKNYTYIKYWRHEYNTTLSTAINDLNKYTPDHSLVIYIDSDDMMMYTRILNQYEIMTKECWSNITLCATAVTSPTQHFNKYTCYPYFNYHVYNNLNEMNSNIIDHPSICYKIDDIRKYNIEYDSNYRCTQDFDFYLNLLSHNLKILLISDSLTYYRGYSMEDRPDNNRKYGTELNNLEQKWNKKLFL